MRELGADGSNKQAYVECKLNETLQTEMGLESWSKPVFTSRKFEGGHEVCAMVAFLAWNVPWEAPQEAKSPVRQPGNHEVECGVCAERRSAALLVPCGHLLCWACARRYAGACPFCRAAVRRVQAVYEP